ncbi:uncharacterized protein EDB93DRAFT_1103926 [Suillus bovinus]|uniref:uncharacterized protein n=1 Tax=Suillus bovinus TaxID=48563 RepID=UPI001B85DAC9|nr:uncharacterized protein EDB93DRAFT_1103926 [Suillus bovinus]KAG2147842.1 hypothetical protein EDB93DRAFT_1103926 [Suillus bovinus]
MYKQSLSQVKCESEISTATSNLRNPAKQKLDELKQQLADAEKAARMEEEEQKHQEEEWKWDRPCAWCVDKGRNCLWKDAEKNVLCQKDKGTCPGRPGTVKVPKGKKRQRAAGSPSLKGKGKRCQKSLTLDVAEDMEYDDQAWVATANNIVAELAWTSTLLERSIEAAEGSRAAADRMSSGLEVFLRQQREFQALLFGRLGKVDEVHLEVARMMLEVEEENEEMGKASRSDAGGSGEAEGSMEM